MSVRLNEDQYALLNQQAANAVLIVIDALYCGKFQGKPMSCDDTRRDLANFLQVNVEGGMLIEEIENLLKKEDN
jgi:hypothetical protein